MQVIRIRELTGGAGGPNASVSFNNEGEYPVTVSNPFSKEEEGLLEWYFEEYLRFPFVRQVDAEKAAAEVFRYGEELFKQVFTDPEIYSQYRRFVPACLNDLCLEIAGSPEFQQLHWEALKDPKLPQPLAVQAPVARKNLAPQVVQADSKPSPTINLLIVTARPGLEHDVAYRTISRPLVEGLRQAKIPVQIDILRPGTYRALNGHLEEVSKQYGPGYYHVIHFDTHGALLSYQELEKAHEADQVCFQARYGRNNLAKYDGLKAFLFLEGEKEQPSDPVEAGELANLLLKHQIPITILNACQSGKQVGAAETSLGSRLMQAGVQMVLAMSYSITVSAAESLMTVLYHQLFDGNILSTAICRARQELFNSKGRRAYFNQTIDLEDWLLPVVYQNREQRLTVRGFTQEEQTAYFERQASRYPYPRTAYGFFGRDLDILKIEKCLLTKSNILLIRGMGGAGKTTLLHHLAAWWQTTHFVAEVFYFGYDEKAWTVEQILNEIGQRLLTPVELAGFPSLSRKAQQAMVADRLRGNRHLLILDNLESITGSNLAILNTLPPQEQAALRVFLADLSGGRTLVLLGSRGGENWLAKGTFNDQLYELSGLDPEAASALAQRILERYQVIRYSGEPDFRKLLKLLDGYPLALEVVLPNLTHQTPTEVLEALQAGDVDLDIGDSKTKTESVLKCIDYSHSNLSPEAQDLLLCFAPFTSVIFAKMMEKYTERLKEQPLLASLPFDRWPEVLREAADWGLVTQHEVSGFLKLQPVFPYFLRRKIQAAENSGIRDAIETAFREHYDGYSSMVAALLESKEAKEKQVGAVLASLEYENLTTALNLALKAQTSIRNPYVTLSNYLDTTQDHRRGLELGNFVISHLESYPADKYSREIGMEFAVALDNIGKRQLLLKHFDAAEKSYMKALSLTRDSTVLEEKGKAFGCAGIYHQLGRVAGGQRQWTQAEEYYKKALQIYIDFKDRYEQADVYHQLGRVAQGQRQWTQAEEYYKKALQIKIDFNDRYAQAVTYHNLGAVAQEQRQWIQAEEYYKKALQIYIDFNDRYAQAGIYHNLGAVAENQRQWTQAEEYYKKTLQNYIDFNDRYEQADTFHQLGIVAQEQGQWTQAEEYYKKALQIKIDFNDRYAQASTHHQLGTVAAEQGKVEQAREYFLKALETLVTYEDEYNAGIVLRNLARIRQSTGDTGLLTTIASMMGVTVEKVDEMLGKVGSEEE
jgi:tetratricopeptide (TPR) repeat protein